MNGDEEACCRTLCRDQQNMQGPVHLLLTTGIQPVRSRGYLSTGIIQFIAHQVYIGT